MKPVVSYSVIITAFREEKTIGRAIEAILPQIDFSKGELWVAAPDEATLKVAKNYPQVKTLKDEGKGKPAALNLAVSKAGGEVLVLTDGDVWLGKEALEKILAVFKNPKVGLATGQPKPVNKRDSLFGFWAFCLTGAAHQIRLKRSAAGDYFDGSGYLLALRRQYWSPVSPSCLTEDVCLGKLNNTNNHPTHPTSSTSILTQIVTKYLLSIVTSGDNANVTSNTDKDTSKKNAISNGLLYLCSVLTIQATLSEYAATVNVNTTSKKLSIMISLHG